MGLEKIFFHLTSILDKAFPCWMQMRLPVHNFFSSRMPFWSSLSYQNLQPSNLLIWLRRPFFVANERQQRAMLLGGYFLFFFFIWWHRLKWNIKVPIAALLLPTGKSLDHASMLLYIMCYLPQRWHVKPKFLLSHLDWAYFWWIIVLFLCMCWYFCPVKWKYKNFEL